MSAESKKSVVQYEQIQEVQGLRRLGSHPLDIEGEKWLFFWFWTLCRVVEKLTFVDNGELNKIHWQLKKSVIRYSWSKREIEGKNRISKIINVPNSPKLTAVKLEAQKLEKFKHENKKCGKLWLLSNIIIFFNMKGFDDMSNNGLFSKDEFLNIIKSEKPYDEIEYIVNNVVETD